MSSQINDHEMDDSAPPNQSSDSQPAAQDADVSISEDSKPVSDGTIFTLPCMGTKNHNSNI
jgi:hypothetical protein